MTPNFELVRGDDRLQCDWFDWWNTTELARAYGWKPRSPDLKRLSELMDDSNPKEVADEDAQSLATVVTECFRMLSRNKRPTRRQMYGLVRFTAVEGNSYVFHLEVPVRIAYFCLNGGFRLNRLRTGN